MELGGELNLVTVNALDEASEALFTPSKVRSNSAVFVTLCNGLVGTAKFDA